MFPFQRQNCAEQTLPQWTWTPWTYSISAPWKIGSCYCRPFTMSCTLPPPSAREWTLCSVRFPQQNRTSKHFTWAVCQLKWRSSFWQNLWAPTTSRQSLPHWCRWASPSPLLMSAAWAWTADPSSSGTVYTSTKYTMKLNQEKQAVCYSLWMFFTIETTAKPQARGVPSWLRSLLLVSHWTGQTQAPPYICFGSSIVANMSYIVASERIVHLRTPKETTVGKVMDSCIKMLGVTEDKGLFVLKETQGAVTGKTHSQPQLKNLV